MIDPDDAGKPVKTGHTLESTVGGSELLIGHGPATQYVVAIEIFQCQGVTTGAVCQLEPALEIDRPDMVGILGLGQLARLNRIGSRSPPAGLDHAVALQYCSNRTARGRPPDGMLLQKQIPELFRSPGRVLAAVLQDELFNHRIGQVGSGFTLRLLGG